MSTASLPNIFWLLILVLVGCSSSESIRDNSQKELNPPGEKNTRNLSGMWLFPQLQGELLQNMHDEGLSLSPGQLYQIDSSAFNRAMVRIDISEEQNGSASFVSADGLILGSYHSALPVLSQHSNRSNNLWEDGYDSGLKKDELPASEYRLLIPIEQTEVTQKIQSLIPDELNIQQRMQYKQQAQQKLIKQRKANNPNLIVEIKDFMGGNRQYMLAYRVLRDLRLVHAPPYSIANHGGRERFHQWPRYSGSYAFFRAYVSPDGSARSYHPDNIPFSPERHLNIDTTGISSQEFLATVGFPDSSHRLESSYAYRYYADNLNPVLIRSQQALLKSIEYKANQDKEAAAKLWADRISHVFSLSYYNIVQEALQSQGIIERNQSQEDGFKSWIKKDSSRIKKYDRVLGQLEQAYRIAGQTADLLYGTFYPLKHNALLQIAGLYQPMTDTAESDRGKRFIDQRRDSILARHREILNSINIEAQKIMLREMLLSLTKLPDGHIPFFILNNFMLDSKIPPAEEIKSFLDRQEEQSFIFDLKKASSYLGREKENSPLPEGDRMLSLYRELSDALEFARSNYSQHLLHLRPAQKRYAEGMTTFYKDSLKDSIYYSDANGTLRLSPGQPVLKDGSPFTTLRKMREDEKKSKEADQPEELEANIREKPDAKNLYVNFLTTSTLVRGSRGSPVINGKGQLVGIALESNKEGIASNYIYGTNVAGAINVDIRYILFLVKNFTESPYLLEEILGAPN